MKILMLGVKEYPYGTSSLFEKIAGGGIAKVIIELVLELVNLDDDIEIGLIVRRMPKQPKFEQFGRVTIYRVNWINNRYLRMPSFAITTFIKVMTIGKDYDIFHAHDAYAIFISHFLHVFFPAKIKVGNPHGGPFNKKSRYNILATFLYRYIEKINLKKTKFLIFTSEAEKKQLCKEYNVETGNRDTVIYNGVKKIIKNTNIEKDNKFNIVFIGRIMPRKGVGKLIESFLLMSVDVRKACHLYIVGDGISKQELEKFTVASGLSDCVTFVGFLNDISSYLSIADLCILPSEGGEGLPMSILEAMSIGVPVAISNFEAPFPKEAYILLPDNEPKTISDCIISLLRNQSRIKQLSVNGQKIYEEKFSIQTAASNYLSYYKKILK